MKGSCLFLAIIIVLSLLGNMTCFAVDISEDYNVYNNVEFAEDRIIVVFDNQKSMNFLDYQPEDFNYIDCKSVTDLSVHVGDIIERTINNIKQHVLYGVDLEEYNGIKLGAYKQILCVEINTPGKEHVIDAIKKIKKMDGVFSAFPDYVITTMSSPNDPYYSDQIVGTLDYLDLIGVKDAWNITTGSNTVRVGIIDSGVDGGHPDLVDNFDFDSSRIYSTGIVQQGSLDSLGHGTAIAGVIGAKGNNNIGITGVCWNVELVSLAVINHTEHGYSSHAMQAIDYAASDEADIDILNMSVGWTGNDTDYYDKVFSASINNFDGLVVCAAGNYSQDLDTNNLFPAKYSCENIITVGALSRYNAKYSTSNYSTTYVDLFAPGDYILTTFARNVCRDDTRHDIAVWVSPHYENDNNEDGYHYFYETSIATPFVTGVAALMLSVNPNLTAVQLKDIILRSVDVVPALQDYCVTGGRLNAYKAVRTASNLRFDYNYTYSTLSSSLHGVICDTCECTCRTADYSCDNCDFGCDPCEACHIYYTELHYWQYAPTDSLYNHTKYCRDCGYTTSSAHNWIESGTAYICALCKKTSTYIPVVTAALPPENDEDLIE